ncbi:MAG: FAD binding domain-containing protein [SAR324 cluster bacterium]|nr:FAD binding domain-containing protein [SAR324 cluster bacterium]
MDAYLRPESVEAALEALASGPYTVLAGGTDLYPAQTGRPLDGSVLDISGIPALRGIAEEDGRYRIGALTTWSDIVRADLAPCFRGLQLAAREVGGVQIQNAASVAGNLCNASPAADGVPPLLTLDAEVETGSVRGRSTIPLAEFIVGNRSTVLKADELVTAVLVPKPRWRAGAAFSKLGARKYLVISIAMAAAVIEWDEGGRVVAARVAVGACSPVARRLPELEAALAGRRAGDAAAAFEPRHLAPLSPIGDVRGSAAYRLDAVAALVRRTLNAVEIP